MKKLILFIGLISLPSLAADLKIEPVYGFERTYQQTPAPARYKNEIFYGVRGTYGTQLLAGELEINQSTNSYTAGAFQVDTKTQNLLIGLKLVPIAGESYSVFMRGGLRAKKLTRDTTLNATTTSETEGLVLDPYAGTGVSMNILNVFNLNASATLVFNRNAEASEQYDTRYTFGAGFKFGNK